MAANSSKNLKNLFQSEYGYSADTNEAEFALFLHFRNQRFIQSAINKMESADFDFQTNKQIIEVLKLLVDPMVE